jgi:hypothetical protein
MKLRDTPRLANWMLEHLTLGGSNDALAGDLEEEFEHGRSLGWYWRQVLAAIVFGCGRQLRDHWSAGAFSVLWAVTATPAYFLLLLKMRGLGFIGSAWRLPWPYSMICELAISLGSVLLVVWVGLTIYLLVFSVGSGTRMRTLAKSLLISVPVFLVASAITITLSLILPEGNFDARSLTYLRLLTDLRCQLSNLAVFTSLTISLICALPSAPPNESARHSE